MTAHTADQPIGTEAEAVAGAFTLGQTKWPEDTRYHLARSQNVAVDRANTLQQALDGDDRAAQLAAHAAFDEAIAACRATVLAMFELEDTAASATG